MTTKRCLIRHLATIALALLLAACATLPGRPAMRTELYFGLGRADATPVDATEWRAFVDDEILKLFPDGFTVIDGDGAWRERPGSPVLREPVKILIVIHPGSPDSHDRIEFLRTRYRERFQQSSVLRVDQPVRAAF